jgi:hypothetical protein
MAKPLQCFHYLCPVNGSYTGTINISITHSQYHSTTRHIKSSSHTPSLHTMNFLWLSSTVWCHNLAWRGVYQVLHNNRLGGGMWHHSQNRGGHVNLTVAQSKHLQSCHLATCWYNPQLSCCMCAPRPLWLNSSCIEQICHSMYSFIIYWVAFYLRVMIFLNTRH